ncbi:MAG: hypothetical protein IC227_01620 [Enterococcus lacertideformus]|uniref:Uncharacterized protein n=1 Tax=Enterococcus lacertideformus TaxID=2771493 RepID=A0A931AV13_9ENTE|nr:hypothetical protein [Enterococcus lacertideformus]
MNRKIEQKFRKKAQVEKEIQRHKDIEGGLIYNESNSLGELDYVLEKISSEFEAWAKRCEKLKEDIDLGKVNLENESKDTIASLPLSLKVHAEIITKNRTRIDELSNKIKAKINSEPISLRVLFDRKMAIKVKIPPIL